MVPVSIEGLLAGSYGNKLRMDHLPRRGGSSKTERKQHAARANGAKGGRPRKVPA